MTEDAQNLARRVRDQTLNSARDFLGGSLGRLGEGLRADRSQLEDLAEQLGPGEARSQVRDLIDHYSAIEASIEEAARDLGLDDATNEAAGQAREAAQGVVGQLAGQIGQVAENLPGGRLLGRTTDESGRTVQRLASGSGDIIEVTLDESGELLDETLVGSLTDLPAEEESTTDEGHTLRTVRDESGALIQLRLGPDGSVLDLEIPDDTE